MNHETLLIGFVFSMVFYELTGIYPGGIVVPAFLAFYVMEPFRVLGTAAAVLATLGVYRLLSTRLILFGRRRFFVLVTMAGLFSMAIGMILPSAFPSAPDIRAIGLVVPGLLANTCQKQGVWVTLAAAIVATTATFLASRLIFSF